MRCLRMMRAASNKRAAAAPLATPLLATHPLATHLRVQRPLVRPAGQPTMVRCAGTVLAAAAAACLVGAPASAQEQRYETPQYTTGGGSTLDKNFGLPSFGMPPQRTQEPAAKEPEKPDFFARTPEYDVQKPRSSTALEMETPLFTTPEESTTGDSTMTDSTFDEPATSDGTTSRYTNAPSSNRR